MVLEPEADHRSYGILHIGAFKGEQSVIVASTHVSMATGVPMKQNLKNMKVSHHLPHTSCKMAKVADVLGEMFAC